MSPAGKVLVLGLGNDILTDDAVGLHVTRAARARLGDTPAIIVRETTEMGLALLDEIAGHEALVLVDAVQTGRAPPGSLHEIVPGALAGLGTTSPHFLGVGETLALGATLGLVMPRTVRIVGIEVADARTLGEGLTPAVAAAVPGAAARVTALARGLAADSRAGLSCAGPPGGPV
jgi:hydrogenase maturation protease